MIFFTKKVCQFGFSLPQLGLIKYLWAWNCTTYSIVLSAVLGSCAYVAFSLVLKNNRATSNTYYFEVLVTSLK